MRVEPAREYLRTQAEHHNRKDGQIEFAGFARRATSRWMSGMRGMEFGLGLGDGVGRPSRAQGDCFSGLPGAPRRRAPRYGAASRAPDVALHPRLSHCGLSALWQAGLKAVSVSAGSFEKVEWL